VSMIAPRRSFLRSDNAEFIPKALLSWIIVPGISTTLIDRGKPCQNGSRKA
jgi:hypothetical protein